MSQGTAEDICTFRLGEHFPFSTLSSRLEIVALGLDRALLWPRWKMLHVLQATVLLSVWHKLCGSCRVTRDLLVAGGSWFSCCDIVTYKKYIFDRSGQWAHTSFLEQLKYIMQATACYMKRPQYMVRPQGRDKREETCPIRFAVQLKRQNLYKMKKL